MGDAATFAGPILVTIVYLIVYYGFQIRITRTKFALSQAYRARGEKFDRYFGQDRVMLAADRTQLNMLEHMPPFLILMWLCAIFVGPTEATIAGAIYVTARLSYPFLLGKKLGRDIKPKILVATAVGYLVLTYYIGMLVLAVVKG